MSLFDEHETPVDVSPEQAFNELVGEGKKYRSPEDLAKAYYHANRTLLERQQELQGLREDLATRTTVEDLLKTRSEPTANTPPQNTPVVENTPKPLTDEELEQRIAQVTQRQTVEQRKAENLRQAEARMLEVYGTADKAQQALQAKATELGVSVDFLKDAAAQSPKAFFVTLGVAPGNPAPATGQPTQGNVRVNPETLTGTRPKEGTWAFYENIRKTDPNAYWKPSVQNQLFKDRTRLGDDFYK